MPQDSTSAGGDSSSASTSENDRPFVDIGSQFADIADEVYTQDIGADILVENEGEGYASVPVGWVRDGK
jgi:hypothetical protein